MTVVVIGLGNELRRDDGIGPAVARRVADRVASDVRVSVSDGDPAALLDAWAGAQLTVLVDAVVCDPPRPGTVHRLAPDELGQVRAGSFSTHGIPLDDVIQLGTVLDRLPHRMVVLAVEVADLAAGGGLSPAVGRAVETAVATVLSVLGEPLAEMS